jgi:hypothetical protein
MKMNKTNWLITAAALLPLCATPALAEHPDTGPGCGLGKMVWSDYGRQKSIAPQVMMATTNNTFGNQTFGISSGTSGCTNDGTIMSQHKVQVFAAANQESLAQEMAQGGGEHLASLAELMGVAQEHRSDFFALAQVQYARMSQSGSITSDGMIEALHSAMATDARFAQPVVN